MSLDIHVLVLQIDSTVRVYERLVQTLKTKSPQGFRHILGSGSILPVPCVPSDLGVRTELIAPYPPSDVRLPLSDHFADRPHLSESDFPMSWLDNSERPLPIESPLSTSK